MIFPHEETYRMGQGDVTTERKVIRCSCMGGTYRVGQGDVTTERKVT